MLNGNKLLFLNEKAHYYTDIKISKENCVCNINPVLFLFFFWRGVILLKRDYFPWLCNVAGSFASGFSQACKESANRGCRLPLQKVRLMIWFQAHSCAYWDIWLLQGCWMDGLHSLMATLTSLPLLTESQSMVAFLRSNPREEAKRAFEQVEVIFFYTLIIEGGLPR